MNIGGLSTVVTDIPADKGAHAGSFIILSFCNRDAIEVKRLADKSNKPVTEAYLNKLLRDVPLQSPLIYALD